LGSSKELGSKGRAADLGDSGIGCTTTEYMAGVARRVVFLFESVCGMVVYGAFGGVYNWCLELCTFLL
jgi:hypothetical protein